MPRPPVNSAVLAGWAGPGDVSDVPPTALGVPVVATACEGDERRRRARPRRARARDRPRHRRQRTDGRVGRGDGRDRPGIARCCPATRPPRWCASGGRPPGRHDRRRHQRCPARSHRPTSASPSAPGPTSPSRPATSRSSAATSGPRPTPWPCSPADARDHQEQPVLGLRLQRGRHPLAARRAQPDDRSGSDGASRPCSWGSNSLRRAGSASSEAQTDN